MKINFKKIIQYAITLIISLGVLTFPFSILTFKYNCEGPEMFPEFYGTPFIYKSTSLATSITFDYYIIGIVANCIIWFLLFTLLRYLVLQIIIKSKILTIIYKGVIVIMLLISALNFTYFVFASAGSQYQLYVNYEKDAKIWGMTCKGEFKFFTQ